MTPEAVSHQESKLTKYSKQTINEEVPPVKVLYDNQIFSVQPYGGISRYYVELMDRYDADDDIAINFPCFFTKNKHLGNKSYAKGSFLNTTPAMWFMEKASKAVKQDLPILFDHNINKIAVRLGDYDILHPTYYDPYFLKYLKKKPLFLVVHDMTHELYSQYFGVDNKMTRWKRSVVDRADSIVAVSENTKKDLVNIFGVDESRVKVIYLACSLTIGKGPYSPPEGLPSEYLLFVGGRWTYKNFDGLLNALPPIFSNHPDLHLVCAGGNPFDYQELEMIEKLGLGGRIHQMPVSDDQSIISLYKNAIAFVFPSKNEGFGLPALEAMECGCPALLSNNSSLPEIGGNAALYFDPFDSGSITESIEKILSDSSPRDSVISRGKGRVKEFSWDKTAAETKKIYLNLAGRRSR